MLLWEQHLCMLNDVFNVTFPTVNHPWVNPQGRVVPGIKQERNKIHDHVVLSQGIWYVLTGEIHTWRGRELICSRAVYLLPARNAFSYLMCVFLISACVCVCDLTWLRVPLPLLLGKNGLSNLGLIQNPFFFSYDKVKKGQVALQKPDLMFSLHRALSQVGSIWSLLAMFVYGSEIRNEKKKTPQYYHAKPIWQMTKLIFCTIRLPTFQVEIIQYIYMWIYCSVE